ncbi:MAG: decaprenylphospho-beta-D-erythro-pentofuranosid-2-ulose 2-reductase [Acidimicrobiales bacterium]
MRDAVGAVQSVLVLGGSSDIGVAAAKRLAKPRSGQVVLAGHNQDHLDRAKAELEAHGTAVAATAFFDGADVNSHRAAIGDLFRTHDGFDVVIVAFGVLGEQDLCEADASAAVDVGQVNYLGAMSACIEVGERLVEQGHGGLVVLSSVAGERPRRSNFIYGSTKAGLDAFAIGLHEALRPKGVDVVVVRPGFVRSKMTAGMKAAPMAVDPEDVARVIDQGLRKRSRIVWAPPHLRWVMAVLRHLPNFVFRRLPL